MKHLALLGLVTMLACSSGKPPFLAGEPMQTSPSTTCPLGFYGGRVSLERTPAGADVVLVAYGDGAEVRRRAKDSAAMYGPGGHRGLGHHGKHGLGGHHGLGLQQLGVVVHADEEDTQDGARIHVTAVEPADRDRLVAALSRRVDGMRVGECE